MGWSLNYHPPQEPELLDSFFLSVGKSLYFANAYESKCRYVLQVFRIVNCYRETQDASAAWDLTATLKNKLLGPTISELKGFPDIDPNDISVLEKAKDARNYIAHEGADIGDMSRASVEYIQQRTIRLRHELEILITGDNLVSRWIYEIEQKEPAPIQIQNLYPKWVNQWVFGSNGT
jgi:hypothetical protein